MIKPSGGDKLRIFCKHAGQKKHANQTAGSSIPRYIYSSLRYGFVMQWAPAAHTQLTPSTFTRSQLTRRLVALIQCHWILLKQHRLPRKNSAPFLYTPIKWSRLLLSSAILYTRSFSFLDTLNPNQEYHNVSHHEIECGLPSILLEAVQLLRWTLEPDQIWFCCVLLVLFPPRFQSEPLNTKGETKAKMRDFDCCIFGHTALHWQVQSPKTKWHKRMSYGWITRGGMAGRGGGTGPFASSTGMPRSKTKLPDLLGMPDCPQSLVTQTANTNEGLLLRHMQYIQWSCYKYKYGVWPKWCTLL